MPETQILASLTEWSRQTYGASEFTTAEALKWAAQHAPDKPAVVAPDQPDLTFGAWYALAEKTVKTLNGAGFTPASRIGMALPSDATATAAYMSVACGMAIMPMNPNSAVEEAAGYLVQARADALIVAPETSPRIREAAQRLGLPVIDLVPVGGGSCGQFELSGVSGSPAAAPIFAASDDLALLMPTSGTTNQRKLVARTQHEQFLLAAGAIQSLLGSYTTPAFVDLNPLYHSGGFYQLIAASLLNIPVAVVPTLQVDTIYRYLALYKPTVVVAVPAILQLLVSAAPDHQTELQQINIKLFVVSSAALSASLFNAVQELFHANILISYGTTETYSISALPQLPGAPIYRTGSVGKPGPGVQVKVVDEDGAALPTGAPGEILAQTPTMIHHYENNLEADAESFRDGWFRVGDTGYVDADGFIYLTGRVKEVINRGGSKISPLDIDEVLRQHPAVVDAATFGFPHSALGEDVATAVIVNDPNVSEADLRLFAARRLPVSEIPSRFVFVDEIPKTTLGKVKRIALAAQFKDLLQR